MRTLLLSMLVVAVFSLCACQQQRENPNETSADSVCYAFDESRVQCDIYAEPPVAPLALAVGEWLSEKLGGYYMGDASDMQALVDFYGQAQTDSLRQYLSEDERPDVSVAFDARMEKVYETDRFVTYALTTYVDLAGAHPSTSYEGVTFRKSDGRRLGWEIVRGDRRYKLNELMVASLKSYLDVQTDEELQELLFDTPVYSLPLPASPPYLLADGIVFIYQQYEIAPYAYGMPGDTISYERMSPLLTGSVLQLIGK